MPKIKHYAVRKGREGPKIYSTWDECNANVTRFPGARFKSFNSHVDAVTWISDDPDPQLRRPTSDHGSSKQSKDALPNLQSNVLPKLRPEVIDVDAIPDAPPMDVDIPPKEPTITLSPEQARVLQDVKAGNNVFFTGSAGTGKSVLLREIVSSLKQLYPGCLAITASTGIAAVNIGGATLHSWAGIGLGDETAAKLIGKFFGQQKFKPVLRRWKEVKALIIDEISMLDGELFDKLEQIAQGTRHSKEPFGGIQLILSGDFCQLPPVPNIKGKNMEPTSCFAFDAQSWESCVGPPVTLTKVFRQRDSVFVDMLNAMRFGDLRPHMIAKFKTLERVVAYDDGIEPTCLFPTRIEVDIANTTRLNQLQSVLMTYGARDTPGMDLYDRRTTPKQMDKLLDRLVVPPRVQLKVGAQVMLVKNLVQGHLVNGSVGTVIGFVRIGDAIKTGMKIGRIESDTPVEKDSTIQRLAKESSWPHVKFTNGSTLVIVPYEFTVNNANSIVEATREQIPLILAWALSIHKSQGQTLDRVKVDLHKIFEKGQAYVALSRATTMEHLEVRNFDAAKVVAHPRVLQWYGVTVRKEPDLVEQEDEDAYLFEEIDDADIMACTS